MSVSEQSDKTPKRAAPQRHFYLFRQFVRIEASGGILLLICAVLALLWANSASSPLYYSLWENKFTIGYGNWQLSKHLLLWINDGLMAVFFFVVGLEIKREVLVGQLSTRNRAALPIIAALGGMAVPALLYALVNPAGEGSIGWAIPMATDIAFTLGILALLGKRIPLSLKVFITALAIADDIGAVLVIALFYTSQITWAALGVAALLLVLSIAMNRFGVKAPLPYALVGIGIWVAVLFSGLHATIAGVALALTIPARTRVNIEEFLRATRRAITVFESVKEEQGGIEVLGNSQLQGTLQLLEDASDRIESPLQRLEHGLHPWVTFAILPLFALANAGVRLIGTDLATTLSHPVTLGIIAGLVIGKPLGISLFAWLAVKLGWAELPENIRWRQIIGVSCLAGVGFTMSIFISTLAFGDSPLLATAKTGIIVASLIAGIIGWAVLFNGNHRPAKQLDNGLQ